MSSDGKEITTPDKTSVDDKSKNISPKENDDDQGYDSPPEHLIKKIKICPNAPMKKKNKKRFSMKNVKRKLIFD